MQRTPVILGLGCFLPAIKLSANNPVCDEPKVVLDETAFRWAMNEDPMVTEKLAEGIRHFAKDQVKLEQLIASKL